MGLSWCIGPPGSGKTAAAVAVARAAAVAGRRVRWVALPTQRAAVLRRLVADGPLLGVEVVSLQQLAYAVATAAGAAQPQIVGTARLALVAEALLERDGVLPTPGEAGLFAAAIAEAKRHGLGPADVARLAAGGSRDVAGVAGEIERWHDVFAAYERLKGAQLDYDDVRREARARSEATAAERLPALVGADVVVVDGLRELAPDDLAWLRRLAAGVDVWASAVLAPPAALLAHAVDVERLPPRPVEVATWRFPNTVAEVRGVLRALARDLAEGHDPRDLAVVAPSGAARALRALAPEFGVELSEEAPRALVDAPFGRLLADLLELPTHPTAGRLLAVPALAAVGRRALAEGLTGPEAAARLADQEGLGDAWRAWRTALTPSGDPLGWARQVVALAGDLAGGDDAERARAQEAALRRAQEAARLARAALATPATAAGGDVDDGGFRAWWLALLRSSTLRERPRPGVALLSAAQATGRRFRRAYVVGAVAGTYDAGEHEDYFVPEDARVPIDALLAARAAGGAGAAAGQALGGARVALPRRYRGLDPLVRDELRTRAGQVVLTHADGDRGGPLRPDAALLGAPHGDPPPEVPTSSALEARRGVAYVAGFDLADGGEASVEDLRRAQECAFRAWAAPLLDDDPRAPWPARARRALTRAPQLDADRRAELAAQAPALAPWLERYASDLERLRYGVRLGVPHGPSVRLDAVGREGDLVRVVRFTLPDEDPRAVARPDLRWAELWAVDLLRSRYPRQAARVELVAWPLGGEPVVLTPDGVDAGDWPRKRARVEGEVAAAWTRWRAGPPRPNPGHRCRSCPLVDVCRPTQTVAPRAPAVDPAGPGGRP
ncbi:MAG: hypothetical protein P1P87_08345 [Trueperaceae bacterium]|nr:hypothetical protein [Trueperaceae bacterium]